jgi:hypothetical protein
MKRQGTVHLLVAAAVLVAGLSAGATTISITGIAGAAGADGAAGSPGGDGTAGGDGQDVGAIANTLGENNTATATGGAGGAGGDGGDGVPAGADGGDGANGGAGGDSTARATGTGASVIATAVGGAGGAAGFAGGATAPGVAGAAGKIGTGGNAAAEALLDASGAGDGAIAASATARTTGGVDATANARGTTDGAGAVTASAEATAGGQTDRIATATAYGSNAGAGTVRVTAFATNFGNTPSDERGEVSATAEGHSTGGGDVIVEAFRLRIENSFLATPSPDVVMNDVVRGSTSGHLTLRQVVNESPTGSYSPFTRGSAITSIHGTNPGGGALSVDILARGGVGAETVLGDILATSITGADVDIDVTAIGEGIFQENRDPGSPPTPSRIHADSNGGSVRTTVNFTTTNQYGSSEGVSVEMVDVATGDTTGGLMLEQFAHGGAGTGSFFDSDHNFVPPGSGGSARSSLTKDTASSSLELRSTAKAGDTAICGAFDDCRGGDAQALASGSNSAGAARVLARAEGGSGWYAPGGDATVEASATTTGDGHEVVVGQEPPPFGIGITNPMALGGNVSCPGCPAGSAPKGGDASSRSTGFAAGDSLVTVWDLAIGGSSRSSRNAVVGPGGDANSTAIAQGGGVSAVKAKSDASGGLGLTGGNAEAVSSAIGLGRVESWARAVGSVGSAVARASADGTSGFARGEALTGFGEQPQLRAQSEVAVGSQRDVAAAAMHGAALASAPADPGLEGSAFFTSTPLQSDVDAALAGNAAMSQRFAAGDRNMLALARWQADSGDDPLALTTDLELTLNTTDQGSRPLALGAFDISLQGDGFESLSFSLIRNGVTLGDVHTFATTDEVLAFFANQLLDLGLWSAGDKLLAHFDLELGVDTRFEMAMAYAVPEPGTGLLLVFGLILCAIYRVTSNPAAIRSQVAGPTPRSRSANFCTRPVGVCGSSPVISR